MKKRVKRFAFLAMALLALVSLLAACGGASGSPSNSQSQNTQDGNNAAGNETKGKIIVGGKDFTEQHTLTKITAIYLKEKGYDVEEMNGMGSTVVRQALENGQVDLYWEYTGTSLVVYNHQPVETDPVKAYEKVKELDAQKGLIWLEMSQLNNSYAILMRKEQAEELGIKTISDLAEYVKANQEKVKFASNAEFFARDDGLKGMEAKYGFQFLPKNVVKMDTGLLYNALKDKQVDASTGQTTEGRIKGYNLVILEDDKQFFPAYNAAPVVRSEVLEKYEGLEELLNELSSHLSSETMTELNYLVDVEHKDVAEVAREWLKSQNLID